ncbi:MAG: FliH/SctL family protein [Verrucomicrobiae bacterium]|nr:FliH/SctL family protein [Verrucomicrobiae bacterium]MDW8344092.1 FliH/SctL family protein [Verrucomicrobiae bacterium]
MKLTVTLPHPVRGVTWAGATTEPVGGREPNQNLTPTAYLPAEEARAREQAAYERGRREAETMLREQLLAQRRELLEWQQGVLRKLQEAIPQVVHDTQEQLIQLALTAAQKVVAGMPISADAVREAVREALAQVEAGSEVTVLLHPEDCAALGEQAPAGVRVQADPQLARGDCVVKTPFGIVDARRATKWQRIQEALRS